MKEVSREADVTHGGPAVPCVGRRGVAVSRPGSFRFHSFPHSLIWLSTMPGVRKQGMGDGLRILSLHPLPGPGSGDSGLGKAACHLPQRTVK